MNYASWGKRFLGYIIDMLVVAPFYVLAGVIAGPSVDAKTAEITPAGPLYYVFILLAIVVLVYNRWIQGGKTGQTWGRKAMGIKLVSEASGEPIGVAMAFVRDLCHFVDSIICYVGWLFPLWDAKKQTIADKIIKTVVVAA